MKTNQTLRTLMILIVLVMSASKVSAQSVEKAIAMEDSKMELVSWLMATKKTESGEAAEVTATKKSDKKQFINSGVQTNRLLNKTFLKKAVTRDIAIA